VDPSASNGGVTVGGGVAVGGVAVGAADWDAVTLAAVTPGALYGAIDGSELVVQAEAINADTTVAMATRAVLPARGVTLGLLLRSELLVL